MTININISKLEEIKKEIEEVLNAFRNGEKIEESKKLEALRNFSYLVLLGLVDEIELSVFLKYYIKHTIDANLLRKFLKLEIAKGKAEFRWQEYQVIGNRLRRVIKSYTIERKEYEIGKDEYTADTIDRWFSSRGGGVYTYYVVLEFNIWDLIPLPYEARVKFGSVVAEKVSDRIEEYIGPLIEEAEKMIKEALKKDGLLKE